MVNRMTAPISPPWPARPALFLDFDGTLLEIAEEPRGVQASARLRELLPALEPAAGGAVAIISGRPIAEIDRVLAPHRFAAAGIHGLERRDADGRIHAAHVDGAALERARAAIAPFVARHGGLALEDKALTVALHYRKRPELAPQVEQFVRDLAARLPAGLEVLHGRKVFEIKPRDTDKGRAIRAFMHEPPFAGRTAVFLGDDVTDEAGFAVVNELDGVSVKVDDGATAARWHLDGVDAVLAWLEQAVAQSRYAAPRNALGSAE